MKQNQYITSLNTTLCNDCTIKETHIIQQQSVLENIQGFSLEKVETLQITLPLTFYIHNILNKHSLRDSACDPSRFENMLRLPE